MQNTELLREQVLQHFPAGAFWIPTVVFMGIMFILSFLASRALRSVILERFRKAEREGQELHWSKRASLLWPARRTANRMVLLCTLLSSFTGASLWGPLLPLPLWVPPILIGLAGFLGAALALGHIEELAMGKPLRTLVLLRNFIEGQLILKPTALISLTTYGLMFKYHGTTGAIILAVGVILGVLTLQGYLWWPFKWVGTILAAPASLQTKVNELADSLGRPHPRTFVLRSRFVNAMAFPHANTIMVTGPLLQALSQDAQASVLLHELGHLVENRKVRILRSMANYSILALPGLVPFGRAYGYGLALFIAALVLLFGRRVRQRSSGWEQDADKVALQYEENTGSYARALEGLHRFNMVPAVLGIKNPSHPDLYDRMIAAGVEPDFPIPAMPAPASRKGNLTMAFFAIVVLLSVFKASASGPGVRRLSSILPAGSILSPLFAGGEFGALWRWSFANQVKGNNELTADCARYLAAMTPLSHAPHWHLSCARLLVQAGHPQDALAILESTQKFELSSRDLWITRGCMYALAGYLDSATEDRDRALGIHGIAGSVPQAVRLIPAYQFRVTVNMHLAALLRATGEPAASEFWLARARSEAYVLNESEDFEAWLAWMLYWFDS
ncbi:MAG: M48 family metalloprotease [bacterium]|nr:M48 family metalloprotease [bacterium]